MAEITGTVGDKARNAKHDVALVQAMLRLVKGKGGAAYFAGPYDGRYNAKLGQAIAKFQSEQGVATAAPAGAAAAPAAPAGGFTPKPITPAPLAPAGGSAPSSSTSRSPFGAGGAGVSAPPAPSKFTPAAPAPAPSGPTDTSGVVSVDGPTIKKLSELLPKGFEGIRTMPDCTLVYLAGDAAAATASAKEISDNADLESGFRTTVASLVNLMYQRHKLVLSLTKSGGRRTFQKQYELATQAEAPTKAGPGESNHNWGRAVDIGFQGIRWLQGDGSVLTDDYWLNRLAKTKPAWSAELWQGRNAIAVGELGLFPSALAGDLIHLQAFDDDKVSMRKSLAALLDTVGAMSWSVGSGSYQCDLGGGKDKVPVGKATQIWNRSATIDAAALAKATGKKAADIKPADVKAMKEKLRAEFETAEGSWGQWTAVNK
ncbi:MAG: hypothetical protein ACJ8AO_17990 [Gemmatimonadaceae bacterium]